MTLAEYERAMMRICFAARAADADLDALGGARERWVRYRAMVRGRLASFLTTKLPRTRAAIGDAQFERCLDHYFTDAPPRTRIVRELVADFARWLERDPGRHAQDPPWTTELARYEATRFVVSYARADESGVGVAALTMERIPVLTRACALVRGHWDVHVAPAPSSGHRAGATALLIFRERATENVETLVLTPAAADLVEALARADRNLKACIDSVIDKQGAAADAVFLEGIATMLADLSDRGVLLGGVAVRPRSERTAD